MSFEIKKPNVLNPALYCVLKYKFGTVRISHQGEHRIEKYSRVDKKFVPVVRGEHYSVCCPLCGDRRFRLSISYRWLSMSVANTGRLRSDLAYCYNENCDVRSPSFYEQFLDLLDSYQLRLPPFTDDMIQKLLSGVSTPLTADGQPGKMLRECRLPDGCVPLRQLPKDHEAWLFLSSKYHQSVVDALSSPSYNVMFCADSDDMYARRRIIFPITCHNLCVGWQGRSINADEPLRWYLPPGFLKCIYRYDQVSPVTVPVIAEGIMSAVACGIDRGVAIFGKSLTGFQLQLIAQRWDSVILATDPETYVPNAHGVIDVLELKHKLDAVLRHPARLIPWPQRVLDLARQKHAKLIDWVPDPADFGIQVMSELIARASSHVSLS